MFILILNGVTVFKDLKDGQRALMAMSEVIKGLPHLHRSLFLSLLLMANPETGIAENLSYRDLALLLEVEPAPGRKGAGIPKKETIRSYLRTLNEKFPDDFKLITQGQKLRIQFLKMPSIYASFFVSEEEYTDKVGDSTAQNEANVLDFKDNIDNASLPDKTIERPISPICNINNKQTNKQTRVDNFFTRKNIETDFYPNDETIETAHALGLLRVTDEAEINAFIAYNLEKNTLWSDFNPIYLQWLKQGLWYQTKQLARQTSLSVPKRRKHDAFNGSPKSKSFDEIMRELESIADECSREANVSQPLFNFSDSCDTEEDAVTDNSTTHYMVMAENDGYLRESFYA